MRMRAVACKPQVLLPILQAAGDRRETQDHPLRCVRQEVPSALDTTMLLLRRVSEDRHQTPRRICPVPVDTGSRT